MDSNYNEYDKLDNDDNNGVVCNDNDDDMIADNLGYAINNHSNLVEEMRSY